MHDHNNRQMTALPIPKYTTKVRFDSKVLGMTLPPLDWNRTDDEDFQTHYFYTSLRDPSISGKTTEHFWDAKTMTGVFPISKYMQAKSPVRSDNSIHRHQGLLAAEAEALDLQWTEQVHNDVEYEAQREDLLLILKPFSVMWDGHLGPVNITQRRIEITPRANPSTQNVYRSALL